MIVDLGTNALVGILSHLTFIGLSWYALQALNFDKLIRGNHIFQARLLFIFLSIAIGSSISNFFLDYLIWSQQLPSLFS